MKSPKLDAHGCMSVSRRRFLIVLAALPIANAFVGEEDAFALDFAASGRDPGGAVELTPTSLVIHGRPRFLAAGSVDYFRCPPALWRDRLLKARRAGLNTVMTYVAWNIHEPKEGEFRFSGIADVSRYLKLCAELEMLAIVRVGPFICDEWEAGGYPAWLIGKQGTVFREPSPITEGYIRRWFERLCHEIVPLQASRGGPVVLVQAENEFYYAPRPEVAPYLTFLRETLRSSGIEVPITACGNGTELQVAGYLETINGYGGPSLFDSFRRKHPEWPLLISEHYTHWMDCWGWASIDQPKREALEQQSFCALSRQVMLSYFCFHGGTNFGYYGSSTWKTDHSWVTTRYLAKSPVVEGGALSERYFAVKSASLPIAQFECFFCRAREGEVPVKFRGPVRARALRSEQGAFIFVEPRYPIVSDQSFRVEGERVVATLLEERPTSDIEEDRAVVQFPVGAELSLAAGSVRPLMLPFAFRVDANNVIDYANATLLGVAGSLARRVVVFWGDPGRRGLLSINGKEIDFLFRDDEPLTIAAGGATVLALSSRLADRAWFVDGRLVVGPAYVGEQVGHKHECWIDEQARSIMVVEGDGTVTTALPKAMEQAAAAPLLSWTQHKFVIPGSEGAKQWRLLDHPVNVEQLGAYYGYSWYRAAVESKEGGITGLLFTSAADRLLVWVNGRYAGICGRGTGESRDLFRAELLPGTNSLHFLCDNMGRSSEGTAHQYKGIWGPVYGGARRESLGAVSLDMVDGPLQDSWKFKMYRAVNSARARFFEANWKISSDPQRGLYLACRGLSQFAWVSVDGVLVGEHPGDYALIDGFGASEYLLAKPNGKTERNIRLRFFGEPSIDVEEVVSLYSYPTGGELKDWAFREWGIEDIEEDASRVNADRGQPCWWEANFAKPLLPDPVFLATQGLGKGQVYLNGEAMGRYWEVGPDHTIYLPRLEVTNRLILFDEQGQSPAQTYLFRDQRSPVTKVLL